MWDWTKVFKAIALLQKIMPELIDLFSGQTPPVVQSTGADCPECSEELKVACQKVADFLNCCK